MPGRLKIRTTREQHQYGRGGGLVNQEIHELQGGWVCPMQVFQDKEDRVMFGKFLQDRHESFEHFLALSLGRKL